MSDVLKSLNWPLIVILALFVAGSWIYFCRVSIADVQRKKFWKIVSLAITLGWIAVIVYSVWTNWPSSQTAIFDASGQLRSR